MQGLVVAYIFLCVHQVCLTVHMEQLKANKILFEVSNSSNAAKVNQENYGVGHIFENTTFLSNDARVIIIPLFCALN